MKLHINATTYISIAIIGSIVVGTVGATYAEYHDELSNLLDQSDAIAVVIARGDVTEQLTSTIHSSSEAATYARVNAMIQRLSETSFMRDSSLYILGQRSDTSVFLYAGHDARTGTGASQIGVTYDDTSGNIKRVFATRQASSYVEKNQWGSWVTASSPIILNDGTVAGVLTVYRSESDLLTGLLYRLAIPSLVALVGVVALLVVLSRIYKRQQDILRQRAFFLTTTSHDVRSPLQGIRWALDLMKNPKADRAALIKKMDDQLKYVIDLVESVLATIRIDFALGEFTKVMQDVVPIFEKAITAQRLTAEQYNVTIKTDFPGQLAARVDKQLLGELISNLLSNALKYTRPGSTVVIRVWQDHFFNFSVSDEGEGMTEDERAQLFKPFYRTQKAIDSRKPGTGMGLTLVKDIVQKHKGTIAVQSDLGKGSVFTVRLPL